MTTEFTRPATWEDVQRVVRLLRDAKCCFALVGGYALAAHGYVRFSEDVDILVDPSPDNTARWIAALGQLPDKASLELTGEEDIFQRQGPYAVRINDVFTIDLLPAACGHPWEELKPYVEELDVDGELIPVLSLRGLLLTKEGMRPKDQADRRVLAEALRRQHK
jgi:hypothetical protein